MNTSYTQNTITMTDDDLSSDESYQSWDEDNEEDNEEKEEEWPNGKWMIGLMQNLRHHRRPYSDLLMDHIPIRTFYKHSAQQLVTIYDPRNRPNNRLSAIYLIQIHNEDLYCWEHNWNVVHAINKTIWISIIQRAWKRKLAERVRQLGAPANQRHFEFTGRYVRREPLLKGLLHKLAKPTL